MYVYADNAATTRVSEIGEKAALRAFSEIYGNPSGKHKFGRDAKLILESSRDEIGKILNAPPDKIFFTSGGTESDNWAVKIGADLCIRRGKKHIISTQIEHHAIKNPLEKLKSEGFEITYLKPGRNGIVSPLDFEKAIRRDTGFATVMYANNVTGAIQPIREIGKICRKRGILFHTDAVQAVGHIPVEVKGDFADMLSASAHKFHGPKGVGFLYCSNPGIMSAFIDGGGQEMGMRSGTENVPGIYAMAAALREAVVNMGRDMNYVASLRRIIENEVFKIKGAKINGDAKKRLPGHLNVSFAGISGDSLLRMLDMEGICVSAASACSAGSSEPNFVLEAMGIPREEAGSSVRISLSPYNTEAEARYIGEKLRKSVEKLRSISAED